MTIVVPIEVGDEVEVVSQSFGWGTIQPGDIGTVVETVGKFIWVDFAKQTFWKALASDLIVLDEAASKRETTRYKPIL